MKASEIFEKDQILTLKVAQALMGKKIAITSPEYRMNKPSVRVFTMAEIITAWDHAKRTEYPEVNFSNYQDYWKSYMTKDQIVDQQNKILLLDEKGERQAAAYIGSFYPETTFTGSDEDREVYYIVLNDEN
ncbi:MAG: hypothetical protein EOM23_04050 [Candidatus Moranbacteria bacterium]|nr:hypothetical protein [Candidatus Moranbacteria bacterium]